MSVRLAAWIYRWRIPLTALIIFLRAVGVANVPDNLALEGSVGWFLGTGQNLIGTFADSDFIYVRLKYYF